MGLTRTLFKAFLARVRRPFAKSRRIRVRAARDFSRHIYHSARWASLQKLAMERTETTTGMCPPFMCERCYKHGILKPAKVVHHITFITPENVNDPSVTLNLDNLTRLCQDCHAAVHSSDPDAGPKRYRFDEHGNMVPNEDQWRY